MPTANTPQQQIDPAFFAAIVREVIARLKKGDGPLLAGPNKEVGRKRVKTLLDGVISVETLTRLDATPTQVFIGPNAIVTPAAKDEARLLGLTLTRTSDAPTIEQPVSDSQIPLLDSQITDTTNPDRAATVQQQLSLRGVCLGSTEVVLSDSPAREVYQHCSKGQRAVMIASIADVHRFADELNPTIWVLDMQRLNLPAAVNAIAQITQLGKQAR